MPLTPDLPPSGGDPFAAAPPPTTPTAARALPPSQAEALAILTEDPSLADAALDSLTKLPPALQALDKAQAELADLQARLKLAELARTDLAQAQQAQAEAQAEAERLRTALAQVQAAPAGPPPTPASEVPGLTGQTPVVPVQGFDWTRWFKVQAIPRLNRFGRDVLLVLGPAGTGKTFQLAQWAAANGCAYYEANARGDSASAMVEARGLDNGRTLWEPGIVVQALQQAQANPQVRFVVCLDELDTQSATVQMALAGLLADKASQRRLVTQGFGSLAVPSNVQLVLTANGTGLNPASRHRGRLTPALWSRCAKVYATRPSEDEYVTMVRKEFPALAHKDAVRISRGLIALTNLADKGRLDVDISIRTAMMVADGYLLANEWPLAWGWAVTFGLDDPKQQAETVKALSEQFPEITPTPTGAKP